LPILEFASPLEEEVREQVTVTEEITRDNKTKKITKKKVIKHTGQKQQVTEEVTVEEEGKAPVTTITEGPVEEIVEKTIKISPHPEITTPGEEEIREQVTVTEETIQGKKPKKITKKKVIKRTGQKQQVTEDDKVEEKGKAPVTTITEGPVEEIVEETIKPLPRPENATPVAEEIREQVTVTEEITQGKKPKKITNKEIIKRPEQKQQTTEEVTVEEGKAPITTIIEGPVEEIVEDTIKSSPLPEFVIPLAQEVRVQVTVTEEIIQGRKPKKITKKKIIKRTGQNRQVTEEVTVAEEGKASQTKITEGPVEEIVEETIKPLPRPRNATPVAEEIREQVTVTEEIIQGKKPKKITKKEIIKRTGQKQQITEEVTVEEEGKVPITTITEGPVEEIVEDTLKPLPLPKFAIPLEQDVREQVTVTEEIIQGRKPKKITKKKIIKRTGQKRQVTELLLKKKFECKLQ